MLAPYQETYEEIGLQKLIAEMQGKNMRHPCTWKNDFDSNSSLNSQLKGLIVHIHESSWSVYVMYMDKMFQRIVEPLSRGESIDNYHQCLAESRFFVNLGKASDEKALARGWGVPSPATMIMFFVCEIATVLFSHKNAPPVEDVEKSRRLFINFATRMCMQHFTINTSPRVE